MLQNPGECLRLAEECKQMSKTAVTASAIEDISRWSSAGCI
jgi:hypothetical protein